MAIYVYLMAKIIIRADIVQNFIQYPPHIDGNIGDHQCGFRRNRSTTDQIFCIRRILKKKWEYNETIHQLFVDSNKAYDS
jgi:hypothetical protein